MALLHFLFSWFLTVHWDSFHLLPFSRNSQEFLYSLRPPSGEESWLKSRLINFIGTLIPWPTCPQPPGCSVQGWLAKSSVPMLSITLRSGWIGLAGWPDTSCLPGWQAVTLQDLGRMICEAKSYVIEIVPES